MLTFKDFQNQEKHINVEGLDFKIPEGYQEGNLTEGANVNLTNGSAYVFIAVHNDSNITKYVNYFHEEHIKNNESVKDSILNIDGKKIYVSTCPQTGSTHYWFVENKKVYSIYGLKHQNIDKNAIDLINSLNFS